MARLTPSRVRDRMESRVRKLAGTYSLEERIKACKDIEVFAAEYRDQLRDQLDEEIARKFAREPDLRFE